MGPRERRPRAPRDHVRAARPLATCTARSCCRRTATTPTSACCSCTTRATARCAATASIAVATGADRGRACSRRRVPETTIRFEVPAGLVVANAATRRSWPTATWAVDGVRFDERALVPGGTARWSSRRTACELHGAAADYGCLSRRHRLRRRLLRHRRRGRAWACASCPSKHRALRRAGAAITDVLRRDHTPAHPTDPDLGFVYGTIIVDRDPAHLAGRPGPRRAPSATSRSSPTPSSTDRRAARARARCSPSSTAAARIGVGQRDRQRRHHR